LKHKCKKNTIANTCEEKDGKEREGQKIGKRHNMKKML
jgi:hypothetical protein